MNFEWDEVKNQKNIKKHKVSFEEAKTVFYDDNAYYKYDIEHSITEERFIIIGMSYKDRALLVSHCVREGDVIRIISARPVDKDEEILYYKKIGEKK